jgi:DNA repair protein RecO (recombination protein O)
MLYRATGVVLRTYKLGEADRIVVLLTKERGKVRAVAKGVRKTRSRFGARVEPTSHVQVQLYETRGELDILTQVETIDHFRAIREDLDRFAKASAMLEAVDHVALEGQAQVRLYQMLVGALRTLAASDSPLVLAGFFLKLLVAEGSGPMVDACVSCGEEADLVAYSDVEGGLLCRACRRGQAVSPDAVALLQDILSGRLGAALNHPASPATHEVELVATRALEHFLERRLRSTTLGGVGPLHSH